MNLASARRRLHGHANDVAPTLTVFTSVTNDNGGALTPAGFTVHVRKGSADVSGSPQPGSASGTKYTLAAGSYAAAATPSPATRSRAAR